MSQNNFMQNCASCGSLQCVFVAGNYDPDLTLLLPHWDQAIIAVPRNMVEIFFHNQYF